MQLIYKPKGIAPNVFVPGSKSIANRLLMLQHLYFPNLSISNIPLSTDTLYLKEQLHKLKEGRDFHFDANDGGTTLRFLLVAIATHKIEARLSGTDQLMSRPHDELISSLNKIGYSIQKKDTYIYIYPNSNNSIQNHWDVDISKSSQFASALMLIAPSLPYPITIKLVGKPVSIGYLEMTTKLMQLMGIGVIHQSDTIISSPFIRSETPLLTEVESDWSSIAYFVSIATIAKKEIRISNANLSDLQPDIAILDFARLVGLETIFEQQELLLKPQLNFTLPEKIERDYTNCPDIALTELVCCFALGIEIHQTGVKHLEHKESDRLKAIHMELTKFDDNNPNFCTHHDHRIAMSLAPLSIIKPIQFDNIDVVSKSFPDFWKQIEKLGFQFIEPHGV